MLQKEYIYTQLFKIIIHHNEETNITNEHNEETNITTMKRQ